MSAGGVSAGGSGGATSTAGTGGTAGASGGTAGKGGGTSAGGTGGSVAACGTNVTLTPNPFGCEFAWGAPNDEAGSKGTSTLDFVTTWVGYEDNGGLNGQCDGCNLARTAASSNARAVYYAYFIGYRLSDADFEDCNLANTTNKCTHGAQWLRTPANRASIVQQYGNYARMTHAASPNKGVVWLLEGDFIQYTYAEQTGSTELTMAELGSLASEIVCAIKTNEPGAIVAINHSSWIRNPVMTNFFNAMPMAIIDLVWTTGMGNVTGGYLNNGDANNRNDGTYTYLSTLSGKNVFVDTSFGASVQSDSWTNAGVANLNQRITNGVIAANVTTPSSDYATRTAALTPQLGSVCQ